LSECRCIRSCARCIRSCANLTRVNLVRKGSDRPLEAIDLSILARGLILKEGQRRFSLSRRALEAIDLSILARGLLLKGGQRRF
jgi:hypothetical protein